MEHHTTEPGLSKKTPEAAHPLLERSQAVKRSLVHSFSVARPRVRDVKPGIDLDVGSKLEA